MFWMPFKLVGFIKFTMAVLSPKGQKISQFLVTLNNNNDRQLFLHFSPPCWANSALLEKCKVNCSLNRSHFKPTRAKLWVLLRIRKLCWHLLLLLLLKMLIWNPLLWLKVDCQLRVWGYFSPRYRLVAALPGFLWPPPLAKARLLPRVVGKVFFICSQLTCLGAAVSASAYWRE